MADAVLLGFARRSLERGARLLRSRLEKQAPAQVLGARTVERPAKRVPRGAGFAQRGARLGGIGCHGSASLEARRLADRIAEPVGKALRLVRGLASGLQALREDRKSTRLNSSHVK